MPPAGMEVIKTPCLICGEDRLAPRLTFTPPDIFGQFHLEACRACGAAQVNPHPSGRALREYFSDPRRFTNSADPDNRPRNLIAERRRRAREFIGPVRKLKQTVDAGRILDVGCGLGLFLELMGRGYERIGVEINPRAADIAQEHVKAPILRADAMTIDAPAGHFDLISVMQTLDHLAEPGRFLRRAVKWLKPGGVLFLSSLINIKSPTARVFGPKFRLLHPFHLVYFTPDAVRRTLTRLGLTVLRIEYPYFNTPYARPRDLLDLSAGLMHRAFGDPLTRPSPPFIGAVMSVHARKGR